MDPKTYIKTFKFFRRLNDYVTNTYYLDLLFNEGDIKLILLDKKTEDFIKTMNILDKDGAWKTEESEENNYLTLEDLSKQVHHKNKNDINQIMPILYNQTLVTICTVFELFLTEAMKTIASVNPAVSNKTLKRFGYEGIRERIIILEELGLKKEKIFNFSEKNKIKYPAPEEYLYEISTKRNDFVHRNILIINSYKELSHISLYFQYFIIITGENLSRHFKIPTDTQILQNGTIEETKKITSEWD